MCNRVVQKDVPIKPGGRVTVLMRGPQGEYELPFTEAVFGGPARIESRNYWIKREGAENVIVPDVTRFGGKEQNHWRARLGRFAARLCLGGTVAATTAWQGVSAFESRHTVGHTRPDSTPWK